MDNEACMSGLIGKAHTVTDDTREHRVSQEIVENDLQTDPENHLNPAPTSAPLLSLSPPHSDE